MIEMFEINMKEVPYFDLQKQRELGVFEYQQKYTTSFGNSKNMQQINVFQ
jgi:hypothetical protein